MKSLSCISVCNIFLLWNVFPIFAFWGYFEWTTKYNNSRTNLYCPEYCKDRMDEHMESCCCCKAQTVWQLDKRKLINLEIEYVGRRGKALILSKPPENSFNEQFFKIGHSNGFLAFMPDNMCLFVDIVEIDFSYNAFKSVTDISCLFKLDALNLSHNLITYVSNSTFSGMSSLRTVDLSYNLIRHIEPYTILQESVELFTIDFSHNELRHLDCTNMVMENTFCSLKYNDNKIDQIVNEGSFKINTNISYGHGGYVDLGQNSLRHFINFTDIGITDLTKLGKFFDYAFDLRNSHLSCDCNMEPYLQKARHWVDRLWKDYFNLTCDSPPNLVGMSIGEVVARNKSGLDELKCNISSPADGCPTACKCYRQPSQDRTVVDCNSAGLTHLPKYMPPYEDLQVFLANNSIKELNFVSYLNRITHLDLSGNVIEKITEKAAQSINKNISIRLQGNNLKSIPSSFKSQDPCKLHLGYVYLPCNCRIEWLQNWLSARKRNDCANMSNIFCTSSGYVSVLDFDFKSLNCHEDHSLRNIALSLAIVTLLLFGGFALCYYYRYEIYLLRKNPSKSRKNKLQYKNDVYITVCEDDQQQLGWVVNVLLPYLRGQGYSVFFSLQDSLVGNVREEEIIDNVGNCRNYIVLLSWNSMGETSDGMWQSLEWRYIWNNFRKKPNLKNIIIINYAQLRPSDFHICPIKAFLRLRFTLDFANRKHLLLQDICERLGKPNKHVCVKTLKNAKPKLTRRISNIIFPDTSEENSLELKNSRSNSWSSCRDNDSVPYKYTEEAGFVKEVRNSETPVMGIHSLSHYRTPQTIKISI